VTQHYPQLKKDAATKGKIDEAFGAELKRVITEFKQKMGYGAK
jgi:F-type H+-transporting ATPase subunit alpha